MLTVTVCPAAPLAGVKDAREEGGFTVKAELLLLAKLTVPAVPEMLTR
jgi:hypothetical protein